MPLSPTEHKVLALADQGKSYKEISSELQISVNTVKTHANRILVKSVATCLAHAAYLRGGPRVAVPRPSAALKARESVAG